MTSNLGKSRAAQPFGRFEWSVARRYLGATRKGAGVSLITGIAFVGIMLSVATLIVVMSVFQGFRVMLLSQLLSVGGHIFVTNAGMPLENYDDLADLLREESYVERATPVLNVDSYFVTDYGQTAARIVGIAPQDLKDIPEINSSSLLGSLETFGVGEYGGEEIVIGWRLSRELGVTLGDTLTAVTSGGPATAFGRPPTTQKRYRVGAIFNVGNSFIDGHYTYMPLEQAQLFGRKKGQVTEIELRVQEPLDIDPFLMPVAEAVGLGQYDQDIIGGYIFDWRDRNKEIFNAVQTERGLMRILMLMIVLVATMLIISGLVMLVKDKRSDIAVMRTMGATEGMVMRMFMLTGATIGVTGATAGVALGALIIFNLQSIETFLSERVGYDLFPPEVYYLDHLPAVFEWQEVGIVVAFTLTMSFIFSAYPAWRASRVDPVEALRYE